MLHMIGIIGGSELTIFCSSGRFLSILLLTVMVRLMIDKRVRDVDAIKGPLATLG